jgi:preprotein translocase subunit SecF
MIRIFHNTHYDFIRYWRTAVLVTILFIVGGLGALGYSWSRGHAINWSIEFTGGTLMQLEFKNPPNVADLRNTLDAAGIPGAEIQQFGTNREFTIRAQNQREIAAQAGGASGVSRQIGALLTSKYGPSNVRVVRTEAVGPRVGQELQRGALIAVLLSFVITLIYLAIRFEWRFGLAAVVATAHDVLTTIAFLKLMNLEVSLTVVAAILTVIGYSLNDTIIIFDRVRENLRKGRKESLRDTLNRSINETLPRSILTHATTFLATFALLLFAGEVIRPFAWVMAFGIFTGTFSSIYVASPILLYIERKWPRQTSVARSGGAGSSTATRTSPTARSRATGTR